ncbi:MAG: hypothetical protein HUK01_08070 [Bacteroidaceae bacterium]|nr:hypothetical protein [Bacteroidaceae bacterium]
MKTDKIIRWALLTALLAVGILAIYFLAGEDNPQQPVSLGCFMVIKVTALAALLGCVKAGKYLNGKGLLPALDEDDEERED